MSCLYLSGLVAVLKGTVSAGLAEECAHFFIFIFLFFQFSILGFVVNVSGAERRESWQFFF